MKHIWTEELAPVVVHGDSGSEELVARIVVTGIGDEALQATLRLSGVLCAITTPPLAAAIDRLLALGVSDLRYDLRVLEMCTSAGIDLWIDSAARVLQRGGDVRLSGATGVVRRALDAVGVSDSAQALPPSQH